MIYFRTMNVNEMIAHAKFLASRFTAVNDRCYQSFEPEMRKEAPFSGCSRSVFLIDEYAFKVVHSDGYTYNNRAEWDFYATTTDDMRALLAKPLYITECGRVLVMEQLDRANARGTIPAYDNLCATQKLHYKGVILSDMHDGNFGVNKDGKVLLLDYGFTYLAASNVLKEYKDIPYDEMRKTILAEMRKAS